MLDMTTLEDAISYTIMCRNKRFIIEISAERLKGEGGLIDIFYDFKDNLDDPDVMCDFETWAVDAIWEHVKRLVPDFQMPTTTLLDYYNAETFVFELVNRSGTLEAIEHPYDPNTFGDARPRVRIVEPDSEVVSPTTEALTPTICRSVLPGCSLHPSIPTGQSCWSRVH